jgi:acyl carrier protein
MNEIELKLREIIYSTVELTLPIEEISDEANLEEYGLNSISYIKVIVAVENAFGIEFDDEELDFSKLSNIKNLTGYVTQII